MHSSNISPHSPLKKVHSSKREREIVALASRMQKGMLLRALLAVAFLIMRACVLVPTLYIRMQWAPGSVLQTVEPLGARAPGV